jgi:hypothetical protein
LNNKKTTNNVEKDSAQTTQNKTNKKIEKKSISKYFK